MLINHPRTGCISIRPTDGASSAENAASTTNEPRSGDAVRSPAYPVPSRDFLLAILNDFPSSTDNTQQKFAQQRFSLERQASIWKIQTATKRREAIEAIKLEWGVSCPQKNRRRGYYLPLKAHTMDLPAAPDELLITASPDPPGTFKAVRGVSPSNVTRGLTRLETSEHRLLVVRISRLSYTRTKFRQPLSQYRLALASEDATK